MSLILTRVTPVNDSHLLMTSPVGHMKGRDSSAPLSRGATTGNNFICKDSRNRVPNSEVLGAQNSADLFLLGKTKSTFTHAEGTEERLLMSFYCITI